MPKRLKAGFGHHRLESCGPSNGGGKIAEDHPDFFAILRSLLSAVDDGLDTLYEPNAVFSQFLGSASMNLFFFPSFFLSLLPLLVFLSFLAFLVFFLFFPFLFRFFLFCFVLFYFLYFIFFFFVCFFSPIDLRLSCVCVVIDTTGNIYVVVFLGWQAV